MRSFATIATLASLAFATLSGARPTGPAEGNIANTQGNVIGATVNGVTTNVLAAVANKPSVLSPTQNAGGNMVSSRQVTGTLGSLADTKTEFSNLIGSGNAPPSGTTTRRGADVQGVPDVLVGLNDKVIPLCHDLTTKITAGLDAKIALSLALEVLGEIKVLLQAAIAQITIIVKGDIAAVLLLKGQVLELSVVAQILAKLVTAIVVVLGLVVKICSSIDITALLALVLEIAGLLATIISLILQVAGGLLVLLCPLLACVVQIIVELKLTALIQVLQIAI